MSSFLESQKHNRCIQILSRKAHETEINEKVVVTAVEAGVH